MCRRGLACLSDTDFVEEDRALMGRYLRMLCAIDCVRRRWMVEVVDSQKALLSYEVYRPS